MAKGNASTRLLGWMLLGAALAALAWSATSSAHEGDRWFATPAGATRSIEGKYRLDVFRKCIAHEDANVLEGDFGKARYDHFHCLITSEVTGRTCWVTAHITGQRWFHTVLTSNAGTRSYGGCGPRDIRRRAGVR